MKKIEWIGVAFISPDKRWKIVRIHDDRDDVILMDRLKEVNVFSSVGPAMRHAEHLAEKGKSNAT